MAVSQLLCHAAADLKCRLPQEVNILRQSRILYEGWPLKLALINLLAKHCQRQRWHPRSRRRVCQSIFAFTVDFGAPSIPRFSAEWVGSQ